jgi:hypothetical protein
MVPAIGLVNGSNQYSEHKQTQEYHKEKMKLLHISLAVSLNRWRKKSLRREQWLCEPSCRML